MSIVLVTLMSAMSMVNDERPDGSLFHLTGAAPTIRFGEITNPCDLRLQQAFSPDSEIAESAAIVSTCELMVNGSAVARSLSQLGSDNARLHEENAHLRSRLEEMERQVERILEMLPASSLTSSRTSALDVASLGADLKGFHGGFTDGVYGYLVPNRFGPGYGNGGDYGAKVVRFALNNFDLSSVSVLDLASVEPDLKGYMTGFRSGAYGYLVPWYSGVPSYNGKIVRFALDNFDVSGVSVLDLADVDSTLYPSINQGYIGGFATGGFGYLVPKQRHGNLVRFRLDNFDVSGVTVLDVEPLGGPTSSPTSPSGMLFGGFQGGFTDGLYGYYYPRQYANGNDQGFLVRVALDSFDANGVSMLNFTNVDPTITGFNGGFAYGGYGYLVPYVCRWTPSGYNTKIVRFALANFDETGVSTVELTTLHPTPEHGGIYSGGFTDGVYGYLVPSLGNNTNAVRFDLQSFTVSGLSQLELANELDMCGFRGGFSDGRFGYLVPGACLQTGESSKVVRISAYAWQ